MTIDVQGAAQEFAQELQDLLDGVLPRPEGASSEERRVQVPFTGGRYAIRVGTEKTKIAVMKNGVLVAAVRVSYQCTADSAQTYLAVHKSSYELYETSDRLPIVRLEYEREAHTKPAAH